MPVLQHRPLAVSPRQLAGARPSIESTDAMEDQLWVMDEAYGRPEKETDLPSASIGRVPSKKDTHAHLHINTYGKADLHDRYMSSEEEPSPSPDSDTESNEEKLKHKLLEKVVESTPEPLTADEYQAEIAVAVPILAMGKPKLIDVTNLAPMHKRKRTEKPMLSRSAVKNAALRVPPATEGTNPLVAPEATKVPTPEERLPKRKDSFRSVAPDSWLPDDGVHIVQEEDEDEHYFPDLELRKAPTYDDYDPYSLSPPRLSPRNSYNSTSKKPGSVARARKRSNPPIAMNSGWKGLTRSMSLAKKQALHRADHQATKKPKMIARAANEREEPLMIPAFPFGDARDVD